MIEEPGPIGLGNWTTGIPGFNDYSYAHLKAFGDAEGVFVFGAIPEAPDPRARSVAYRTGTYPDLRRWIRSSQEGGCGIFVMPNESTGSKAEDVQAVRAVFMDFDNVPVPRLTLEPTLRVRTPRGEHVSYAIEPSRDFALWRLIQAGMAQQHGADPRLTNPNRLMRLAGTLHLKETPKLVTVLRSVPSRVYRLSDFERFAVAYQPAAKPAELSSPAISEWPFPYLRTVYNRGISHLRSAKKGERFNTLQSQTWMLGHYIPYGLDRNVAFNGISEVISSWTDEDTGKRIREASEILKRAALDGVVNSPYKPPTVVQDEERTREMDRWIASWRGDSHGHAVTVQQIIDRHPPTPALSSDKQIRNAVGNVLRSQGYTSQSERRGTGTVKVFRD